MKHLTSLLIAVFLLNSITLVYAQERRLFMSREIKQTYEKGVRSFDLKSGTAYRHNTVDYNIDIIRSQFLHKLDHQKDQIRNFTNEVAFVHFTVNSMNEIVILHTGTDNPELDKFIKMNLNYERINIKNILIDNEYFIKITFRKSGICL